MRKLLKKLAFPLILILILSGMTWLMIRNYETVNILSSQGKNPVSIVTPGAPGKDGESAYDIAVKNGYKGSEQDWLATFKGQAGQNGLSAYQVAVQNGYNGTVGDWLSSLIGLSAYEVAVANGFFGSQQDWLASLVGLQGPKGDTGATGAKGDTGDQGPSGASGASGQTPVIACVSRQEPTGVTLPDRTQQTSSKFYVGWKYQGQDDSAASWRLIYKINSNDVVKPCTPITP